MPAAKQLKDQVFGRLTVLDRCRSRNGRVTWLCRCECGKLHEVVSHALTSGHTKSCGCWKEERNTSTQPKHGHASRSTGLSPTYQTWRAMWTRCTNKNVPSYKDYGGRGITICARWAQFGNFLADMGERPKESTIERKDTNGGYESSNCIWATKAEQSSNTRANRFVEFQGQRLTQAQFARLVGHNQSTISYRMRAGWTAEQINTTPANTRNRIASKLGDEVEIPEELFNGPPL